VIVLNDWMCDTTTWDGARVYLDLQTFTWAFADLRGYGRSLRQGGELTVEEAAYDVVGLADELGWERFAVIGHSMSSLVALHLAQTRADRVTRVIALTPPPPMGFGADAATLENIRALGRADDAARLASIRARSGDRLSPGWTAFKVARWSATSDPEAVAGYAAMFARDGLPDPKTQIVVPVLAVTGEHDVEIMRSETVNKLLSPICADLVVTPIAESAHYPMQETPPLLVTIVERFLA